jgi:hypothetical protein
LRVIAGLDPASAAAIVISNAPLVTLPLILLWLGVG